jgi:hypothetical protein
MQVSVAGKNLGVGRPLVAAKTLIALIPLRKAKAHGTGNRGPNLAARQPSAPKTP